MNIVEKKPPEEPKPIVIGYYPIRGKAQVPRLLCEYLRVPYIDQFFGLQEWNKYKAEVSKDWEFADLPFMIDSEFVLTEPFPICEYVIEKMGRVELLGRSIADQGILQMYLWTIDTMGSIISINCAKGTEEEKIEFKENQWKNNVLPRLEKYEQFVRGEEWFLGYLTIIDFSIYELIRYMEMLFPGKLQGVLPKLNRIRELVLNLPAIKEYECSSRAIHQMDPSVLLRKLKESQ